MSKKYKVDDKVKVREWDDMAREFGVDDEGDILCPAYFTTAMKGFCGKIVTIAEGDGSFYNIVEDGDENYNFSDEMFEPTYPIGEKRKKEYKVGDVVKIRKWEDMEYEFGLNPTGSIKCEAIFTDGMRGFCGKKMVIRSIFPRGESEPFYELEGGDGWAFSSDMFEEIVSDEEIERIARAIGLKATLDESAFLSAEEFGKAMKKMASIVYEKERDVLAGKDVELSEPKEATTKSALSSIKANAKWRL